MNEKIQEIIAEIKKLVDVSTVIGDPITVERTTLIPVSKVGFGFASGGNSLKAPKEMDSIGVGAGISITPVCFLVIEEGKVRVLSVGSSASTLDRAIENLPLVMDKVSQFFPAKEKEEEE